MATVPCGFHTNRWARAYVASVHEMLGAPVPPRTFTAWLGPDPDALHAVADSPAVLDALRTDDPAAGIQPYAERVRRDTRTDFVVVMSLDRTRYSHPDPARIGEEFIGDLGGAPQGEAFTQEYTGTLGRSMRRNVEYYARRLFKKYRCEFQRVNTDDELQTALAAMVDLHIGQWLSKGEIGSLSSPVFQRFLRDAARSSFADSRLRVWTLRIEGRIEGVLLGFLDDGILHYFQKGHNPAFSKDDLGTALVSLCIRDCCDDPHIRAFDFMGGGAAYKEMWARQVRLTIEGVVSRKNIRARAFEFQYRLGTAATAVYRAVIPLKLRAARRDWLNARNFRDQLRRLGHNAAGAFVPMSALPDGLDWTITSIETAILLIVGLS